VSAELCVLDGLWFAGRRGEQELGRRRELGCDVEGQPDSVQHRRDGLKGEAVATARRESTAARVLVTDLVRCAAQLVSQARTAVG
jgi:hypothetical protein